MLRITYQREMQIRTQGRHPTTPMCDTHYRKTRKRASTRRELKPQATWWDVKQYSHVHKSRAVSKTLKT